MSRLFFIIFLSLSSCAAPQLIRDHDFINEVEEYDVPKQSSIGKIIYRRGIAYRDVGYVLYDVEQKKIVQSRNSNTAFMPASNMKLVTNIAALEILGDDYQFKTYLRYRGRIKNRVLHGDLYLVGGGDPLLSSADLLAMAELLKSKGIDRVKGNFYYDDHSLIHLQKINNLQADEFSYNPGVSALSSEFNQFKLFWQPKGNEGNIEAYGIPHFAYDQIALISGQDSDDFIYNGSDIWMMSDINKHKGSKTLPVKNPSKLTANVLRFYANIVGVKLPSPNFAILPRRTRMLVVHKSKKLHEIAHLNLNYSNNLMSELLLLKSASQLSGKALPMRESIKVIKNWYQKKVPQVNWAQVNWQNGSGLSAETSITARQMLEVLKFADRRKYDKRSFFTFLPTSGINGTLKSRMSEPESALRVWAKTGSMYFISALSGYMFSQDNQKYIFVILMNDKSKRKTFDSEIKEEKRIKLIQEAGAWGFEAKLAQDEMVKKWISRY
jgi:D-alanyl-D-alanine carboxypeptidase/D-alanyl-D-alanine-endopeptidase (penicillin-binding protein 4)